MIEARQGGLFFAMQTGTAVSSGKSLARQSRQMAFYCKKNSSQCDVFILINWSTPELPGEMFARERKQNLGDCRRCEKN